MISFVWTRIIFKYLGFHICALNTYLCVFYLSYILPKLLPKSKTWMKDLAVNTKKIGDKVHLPAIIRSMNSKSIFEE